jgi:tetratricopeptide (TPR) repeat protein
MSGCQTEQQQTQDEPPAGMIAASAVTEIPVMDATDMAMADFEAGLYAMDVGRFNDANDLFRAAAEKDPDFGSAYLYIANTANSLEEYKTAMDRAVAAKDEMSDGEKILVDINMTGFTNDVDESLTLAERLVELYPASPRAWLNLGFTLGGLNRHEEARTAMGKSVELDPTFIAGHSALAGSYLFNDPKDFALAEVHTNHAIDLAPQEAGPHIAMGDLRRAQQDLIGCRESYRRATEVDPTSAVAFSKSGHPNSFLGYYDEARSDFDRASALAEGGGKATWMNFKAYVHVYEGNSTAAIEELGTVLESIDAMGIPEDEINGAKVFVLSNIATIAMHEGMVEIATKAVEKRNELVKKNAEIVGTEEFTRSQKANIAAWNGMVAATAGDYEAARAAAGEYATLVETQNNPRKMELYHAVLGWTALQEGNHQMAVEEYRQSNLNNIYNKYMLAVALEGAGFTEQATKLFTEVAEFNFNSVGYALVRNAAIKKVEKVAA